MPSLTVLGSGTMVPDSKHNPAGFLLEINRKKILLDCGFGVIRHLVDFGYQLLDIDYLFISHFHCDHCGDAFNLINSRYVQENYEKKSRQRRLTIWGPKTIEQRFEKWRQLFWLEPKEFPLLKFIEGPKNFTTDNLKIELFPVKHVPWFDSVGISIKYKDYKIVYPGDIGSEQNLQQLINYASQADIFICEAAATQDENTSHFSLNKLETVSQIAKIRQTLIVHVPPRLLGKAEKLTKKYKNIKLAYDGLKLTF